MRVSSSAYDISQEQYDDMTQTGWLNTATGGATDKAASVAQAQYTNYFNEKEAQKERMFNKQEAELARIFSAQQAELSRQFNSAEAQKNRDYQTLMSNSQYKRAMQDMKNAGLNPALMYAKGGMSAGTPGGATASSNSAGTVGASSSGGARGSLPGNITNNAGALAMLVGSAVAAGVSAGGKVAAVNAAGKQKILLQNSMMPSWW